MANARPMAGARLAPAVRWVQGLILCAVAFFLISAVAFWVHGDQSRLRDRVKDGLPAIASGEASGQGWADCVVLSGAVTPAADLIEYAGSPWVIPEEPCPTLHETIVSGGTPGLGHYDRYWFGSLYLTTIGLGIFALPTLQLVYKALLMLSIAGFGLAGFLRLGHGLRAAPVIVSAGLLAGIGIQRFGGDVSSAAAYFLPLFGLTAFLVLSRSPLDAAKAAWLGSILGALAGYYDLLCGGIPLALSLSILTYYLLWQDQDARLRSLAGLVTELAVLSMAFFLSVVALLALKLFVAAVILGHPHAIAEFRGQLLWRTSGDRVGGTRLSGTATVFAKLLGDSPSVFLLGWHGAVLAHGLGAAAWIAALLGATRRYAASRDRDAVARFIGPLLAAAVIPAWFTLFLSHGFIHSWFMARIVCIVPTFGVASAWMVFARAQASGALPVRPAGTP
ncbi:MAG: hypothetical protein U1E53_02745 [Dongiaceae bacterium]